MELWCLPNACSEICALSFSLLGHMSCAGVLVPCVKALQFVTAAESWNPACWSSCVHMPVIWCTSLQKHCLSAGWAFAFRASMFLYASRHDSTSASTGTKNEAGVKSWGLEAGWDFRGGVCWHKLCVGICSRAETIFHWNTSLAVFQSHISKKQGSIQLLMLSRKLW